MITNQFLKKLINENIYKVNRTSYKISIKIIKLTIIFKYFTLMQP